jgi:hypothetical protein
MRCEAKIDGLFQRENAKTEFLSRSTQHKSQNQMHDSVENSINISQSQLEREKQTREPQQKVKALLSMKSKHICVAYSKSIVQQEKKTN